MKLSRRARLFRPTPRNLAFLAARLQAGELVAVPTETVYGLAGDALNPAACRKIFKAKGRPTNDPLIVHVHSLDQLHELCVPNAAALGLARKFWPGPLTLILPKLPIVSDLVTAGKDSVAVRMPSHPVFRRLLKLAGRPLAAPSANPFGYISPTTAAHVADNLGKKIAYILDGGAAQIGLESTIVDLRDPKRPAVLRPGAISAAEIARVLRRPVAEPKRNSSAGKASASAAVAQVAPGMLARHYSPHTPVVLHDRIEEIASDKKAGSVRTSGVSAGDKEAYLFLRRPAQKGPNIFWLDERGSLKGIAHRLFAMLRLLDTQGFTRIHVEQATGGPLAAAINDRLRRAAAR
ncbi:MAG: L-threonylcarbamoyladenylate synthase [Verrucomicrobiota bacterium]